MRIQKVSIKISEDLVVRVDGMPTNVSSAVTIEPTLSGALRFSSASSHYYLKIRGQTTTRVYKASTSNKSIVTWTFCIFGVGSRVIPITKDDIEDEDNGVFGGRMCTIS